MRGLIAILFALYSGKPAREILATDAVALFEKLALREHLTPQRSNGFRSMVERIKSDARAALARQRLVATDSTGTVRTLRDQRRYFARRRRCWPRPICLASCERAAA